MGAGGRRQIFMTIAGAAVWMAVAFVVAVGATRQQPRPPLQKAKTFAELRAVSPPERARAKYFDLRGFTPLTLRGPARYGYHAESPAPPPPPPNPIGGTPAEPTPEPTQEQLIARRVCFVDIVAVGRVNRSRTMLTETDTWLFTDFIIAIDRFIRAPNRDAGARTLLVSDPGGRVELGGELLEAEPVPNLSTGESYLLFLRWAVEADAYLNTGWSSRIDLAATASSPGITAGSEFKEEIARVEAAARACK